MLRHGEKAGWTQPNFRNVDMLPVCLLSEDRPFVCNDDAKWMAFRQALIDRVPGLAAGNVR